MAELTAAVLDTCVLIPSRLRDFLLSLAAEHCFRPVWSDEILTEVAHHEQTRHQQFGLSKGGARDAAHRLIHQLTTTFDDSLVDGWQKLNGTFGLPDANDEHVLAVAVVAHAAVIVTNNLKDFPSQALPGGLEAITPAEFTARIARRVPGSAANAVRQMSARLHRPPMKPGTILDYLESHYAMTETASLIRPWLGL